MPCHNDTQHFMINSGNEIPQGKPEKSAAKSMRSQPSFQSNDSDFFGLKPPVTTPTRMSRRSSAGTLVYQNEELDRRPRVN